MEYLKLFFLSMIPIVELRGAIPLGIAMGLKPIYVYIVCIIIITKYAPAIEDNTILSTLFSALKMPKDLTPLAYDLLIIFPYHQIYFLRKL